MTRISFNPESVQSESRESVPVGTYVCKITSEAVKPTKNQTGAYLELHLEVQEGVYAKRTVIDRVNLKNDNAKAVEIGLSRLAAICKALSIEQLDDTNQLIDGVLSVSVGLERDKETKQPTGRNSVMGYAPLVPVNTVATQALDDLPF